MYCSNTGTRQTSVQSTEVFLNFTRESVQRLSDHFIRLPTLSAHCIKLQYERAKHPYAWENAIKSIQKSFFFNYILFILETLYLILYFSNLSI